MPFGISISSQYATKIKALSTVKYRTKSSAVAAQTIATGNLSSGYLNIIAIGEAAARMWLLADAQCPREYRLALPERLWVQDSRSCHGWRVSQRTIAQISGRSLTPTA